MLEVVLKDAEYYDSVKERFVQKNELRFEIEHSLISIARWESKWCKPFLTDTEKTDEEILSYIQCMCIGRPPSIEDLARLDSKSIDEVTAYIKKDASATTINDGSNTPSRQIITSELIYAWMIEKNVPPEYQKWHISRLLKLLNVLAIRANPKKSKMNKMDRAAQMRKINAERNAAMNKKEGV